jgi:hypothetical protein
MDGIAVKEVSEEEKEERCGKGRKSFQGLLLIIVKGSYH